MADNINAESMNLVEAVLFVSGKAMDIDSISSATGIASKGYLENVIKGLSERYKSPDTALSLISIGGKYMLSLKEPYATKVNGLAGAPDISKPALRTLAYISKKEPVMQSELVRIFGSSVYDQMKELLDKDFVKAEKYGRTKRITTTQKFKEYFGIS